VFDGEREILERTLIHNWMKQWLKWSSWYYTVALSPDPSITDLLSAPMQLPGRGLPKIFNSFGMAKSGNAMIWVQDLGLWLIAGVKQ